MIRGITMRALSLVLLVLLLPALAVAQTLTPTCTVNADGATKTCISEIAYDGTTKYVAGGSAIDRVTGDSATFSAVIIPLCGPVTITRPPGKLQLTWVCNKDLDVTYTLTPQ